MRRPENNPAGRADGYVSPLAGIEWLHGGIVTDPDEIAAIRARVAGPWWRRLTRTAVLWLSATAVGIGLVVLAGTLPVPHPAADVLAWVGVVAAQVPLLAAQVVEHRRLRRSGADR